jgi:hypothetical protein
MITESYGIRRIMKNKKPKSLMLTKESQADRKKRVTCGVKYRAAIFENKKNRQKYKNDYSEEMI